LDGRLPAALDLLFHEAVLVRGAAEGQGLAIVSERGRGIGGSLA
jgi:hypothetical protein